MDDEPKKEEHKRLDPTEPEFIMPIFAGILADTLWVPAFLGLLIPIVGQFLFALVLFLHFISWLIIMFFLAPKVRHLIPKLVLYVGGLILPTVAIPAAIILQNRLIEIIVTQAALAALTGGVGNVAAGAATAAEGAAAGARAAQVAAEAAQGAKAATTAARGAEAVSAGVKAESLAGETLAEEGTKKAAEKTLRNRLQEKARDKIAEKLQEDLDDLGAGDEEKDEVSEEAFGIKEETDKTKELFEPNYEEQGWSYANKNDESLSQTTPESTKGDDGGSLANLEKFKERSEKDAMNNKEQQPGPNNVNIDNDDNIVDLREVA